MLSTHQLLGKLGLDPEHLFLFYSSLVSDYSGQTHQHKSLRERKAIVAPGHCWSGQEVEGEGFEAASHVASTVKSGENRSEDAFCLANFLKPRE